MKRILVLCLCVALGCACLFGCSASPQASDASESPVALDVSKELDGMKYKVSGDWETTDAGAAVAYSFAYGEDEDVVCSITVAAMDQTDLAAANTDGGELANAFATILGVESVASESTKFEGKDASSFSGINEAGYNVEGYVVPSADKYFVLMMMSTDLSNADAKSTWEAFQDSVELP